MRNIAASGRNDLCGCGSGRKFKKCCGNPAAPIGRFDIDQVLAEGVQLHQKGLWEEAEAAYCRILAVDPGHADALHLSGLICRQRGRLEAALTKISAAVSKKPAEALFRNSLGVVLKELGRIEESVSQLREALRIAPAYAEALNNLGIGLKHMGLAGEAIASYRQALKCNPYSFDAWNNLGNSLKNNGNLAEALVCYRNAIHINPNFAAVVSSYLMACQYGEAISLETLYSEHCAYGERFEATHRSGWRVGVESGSWPRALRVGMVSGDLHNHPVGYFLESVLASLDHKRIEVTLYPTHNTSDGLTERLRSQGHGWQPLYGLNDDEAARRIEADGIDILVDLSGHTTHNRLLVFARKPAPIQVTWLGYFATTGLKAIDYILADAHVIPESESRWYSETPWRLPDSYLCFTPPVEKVAVGELPSERAGHIVFGCFNNLTKMGDPVVALWSRILHAVAGSKLYLQTWQLNDPAVRQATLARYAAHGIGEDRLILEGAVPRQALLESYNRVDIALDPYPFPGGTTTLESLWMGVPVLTRRGDRFLSHVGESLVRTAGLPDWVAEDDADYVAKAVAKAADVAELAKLRRGLRAQLTASPLCDAPRFARNLENAFVQMWTEKIGETRQA